MRYAIVGFGKIGDALAKAFARKGIEVSVATARDPESFAADAAAIGPTIIPKELAEAVKAAEHGLGRVRLMNRDRRHHTIRRERKREYSMSIEDNVQTVKDFFAAMGRSDKQGLLAWSAEDIEWIIPGKDWPLAGTHRGPAGLEGLLQKASEMEISSPTPLEYVAQGDRVLVVGFASGRIKATNRTFEDHWVLAITVRKGKLTNIREYIDTQALARASETAASPRPLSIETDIT